MTIGLTRYGAARKEILSLINSTLTTLREKQGNNLEKYRLPSEDDLSYRLGVSTATIREALRMLDREGIVSKKHGIGNFFHPSALELDMRIDLITDFSELLGDAGYNVEESVSNGVFRFSNKQEQKAFSLKERVYSYDRNYMANGKQAILTRNIIPARRLSSDVPIEGPPNISIMDFIGQFCHEIVIHSTQEMNPTLPDEETRKSFSLAQGRPIIVWTEVFYSYKDEPFGYGWVAFHPDIVKMHLLRKWS
jgi:GntR family transcriptional regulator